MFGLGVAAAVTLLTGVAFPAVWYALPARRRRTVHAYHRRTG